MPQNVLFLIDNASPVYSLTALLDSVDPIVDSNIGIRKCTLGGI